MNQIRTTHPLKHAIEESGMKKTWVAKKVSIGLPLLSWYLNGHRPMPKRVKNEIETILNKMEL